MYGKPWVLSFVLALASAADSHARTHVTLPAEANASAVASSSSARFVENLGQWPESVRYLAELPGARVRAECDSIAFELADSQGGGRLLRLRFEGASDGPDLRGLQELGGTHNFFLGPDPARWYSGTRAFARVRWTEVWPGIDLVLYQGENALEYDLEVQAGANLGAVALRWEGMEELAELSPEGTSVRGTLAELLHLPGRCYQPLPDGGTRELVSRWHVDERGLLRVEVPERDPALALVIDPELLWSTYLGGPSHEGARAIAWGADGTLTVAGPTTALGFPQTPGAFQAPSSTLINGFVARFSPSGELRYSSVFGPLSVVGDVAVAPNGEAVVVGETESAGFPLTPDAYDTTKDSYRAAFVTRLSREGSSLVYSTLLEGQFLARIRVALDSQGRAVVGGGGDVTGFPLTTGTYQAWPAGDPLNAFVSKLDAGGSSLVWSTVIGGDRSEDVSDIGIGPADEVTLFGSTTSRDFPTSPGALKDRLGLANQNTYVCRLDASATQLLWSTYLGGTTLGREDYAEGLAACGNGDVVVVGRTDSPTFPVTSGTYQTQPQFQGPFLGFVSRVREGGDALVASTFLVDSRGWGTCRSVSVDFSGVVTVAGGGSIGFPMTPGSWDPICENSSDTVIVRLAPALDRLFYSSFLGGYGQDGASYMAMTQNGRVAMAGQCWVDSQDWPVTQNAYQPFYGGGANDAVVTVLDLVLEGIRLAGNSSPSCLGPLQANASAMPLAGSSSFSLWCSGAPPNATGLLLLGFSTQHLQPIGAPSLGLHPLVALVPVASDSSGFVETTVPLVIANPGTVFSARYAFAPTPRCQGTGLLATSNTVIVTVQ